MYTIVARLIRTFALASALFISPLAAWAEATLLMAEEPGCMWCARWNAQIAPIYEKTGEGAAAPLRRMDITQARPADISLARPVVFTPTFVLLIEGAEVSRMEGYPGEDFFWGLLGAMLDRNGVVYTVKENIPTVGPDTPPAGATEVETDS